MASMNCWEYKKCGREPNGAKIASLGVCPAADESRTDGVNRGKNGGRSCWAIAGTLCGGVVQGTYAAKLSTCIDCEFYLLVAKEEGPSYQITRAILSRLSQ
jgi:hypothetical protein